MYFLEMNSTLWKGYFLMIFVISFQYLSVNLCNFKLLILICRERQLYRETNETLKSINYPTSNIFRLCTSDYYVRACARAELVHVPSHVHCRVTICIKRVLGSDVIGNRNTHVMYALRYLARDSVYPWGSRYARNAIEVYQGKRGRVSSLSCSIGLMT